MPYKREKSKLLIVDHDPYTGQYLTDLFVREGFSVFIEEAGHKTIQRAQSLNPDLIILDAELRGISGFDICRDIRNNEYLDEIPVILMSSLHNRENRIKGIEAGADDFFVKPFDRDELRVRVRTITRLDRYRRLLRERERIEEIQRKEDAEKLEMRKKSERALEVRKRHFETLAELSAVGIFSADENGVINYVNNRWQVIFGIKEKDALNKHWLDFLDKDKRHQVSESWKRFLSSEEQHFSIEHPIKKDEHSTWIYVQLMADIELDNTNKGFVGTVTDLTEQKQREQEVLTAIVNTQESERKRFAENLHDSVGQMLSAVKMYLNAVDSDILDDENAEMYKIARNLLTDAINETRTISHGLMPSGIKDFGLIRSLGHVVNMLQMTGRIQVNFNHSVASGLDDEIKLGIYRMVQEISNNAIKHAEPEHVTIHLKETAGTIELSVTDDGRGFHPEKVGSEGIGLKNIQNRVKYLSGTMNIASEPGSGTSIRIRIPINREII